MGDGGRATARGVARAARRPAAPPLVPPPHYLVAGNRDTYRSSGELPASSGALLLTSVFAFCLKHADLTASSGLYCLLFPHPTPGGVRRKNARMATAAHQRRRATTINAALPPPPGGILPWRGSM